MKIIEYNDSYALKVAEMWNKSNSNWGNEESLKTSSEVIAEESSSGNEKLYLAIENNEVVGYCSLSEYKYDEGASYLPLLNVIPEYHGKKIGKALILKVIEDAIKSRWKRFDLFTWSGNIKAMPLYKKCGFFWEKRNNTVHLMNFIPYLYQTEALLEYLKDIDWYKDSIRNLDLVEDGEMRKSFEYYRYDFENKDTKLAVEFEKTGRGLRFIETRDYLIEMTIDEHDLVFDNKYEVKFRMLNKSGKDLNINLDGIDNKNIKCSINEWIDVVDEVNYISTFYVGKIEKDQNKGETHPVVEVNLRINGKLANFKTGIEPKYPVKLQLQSVEYNHVLGDEYNCYLDVENNLESKETFFITLPDSFVKFKEEIKVELNSKEKRSLKVKYKLNDYGFYNEYASIKFGDKSVKKKVSYPFKGSNSSFTCLMEERAMLVSGNYVLAYNLNGNNMSLVNGYIGGAQSVFFAPRIGMPYSLEFTNAKPVVEFPTNNDMKITFTSETFKNVLLIIRVNNSYGLLAVNYEIVNNGKAKEFGLSIPVRMRLEDCAIPYDGELLEIIGSDGGNLENISYEKVDENWIYNKKLKYGFVWGKDESLKIGDWQMMFDKSNIKLGNKETYRSSDFFCSFVHPNVKDFRAFAGNKSDKDSVNYLEVVVNEGNPFASEDIVVSFKNNRKIPAIGTFKIDEKIENIEKSLKVNSGLKKIDMSLKDREVTYSRLVHKVKGKIEFLDKDDILEVSNGELSFKASSKYSDSIYSLQFNGYEWLDSNYPTPKERAWWSNFVGGIHQRCQGLQDNAALKEKRSAKFVKLKDNFGNEWEGIKISLQIQEDPDLKGLAFDSYYLTLPGVKLIHTFTNIKNNSGKLLFGNEYIRFNVLKIDDDKKAVTFNIKNAKYKCNDVGIELTADKLAIFEGKRKHKLCVFNKSNDLLMDTQPEYTILFSEKRLNIADQENKQLSGDFIFFSEDDLDKDCVIDLENIKFDV